MKKQFIKHLLVFATIMIPFIIIAQNVSTFSYKNDFIERRKQYQQQYDTVQYFTEQGIAIVKNESKSALFDAKGKWLTDFVYNEILPIKNGKAAVRKGNKWGFVDNTGKEIIACKYENDEKLYKEISFFSPLAWVKQNNHYGLIDTAGNIVYPFEIDSVCFSSLSYALMKRANDSTSLSKASNKFYWKVKKGDKYGVINNKGETILPIQYKNIEIIDGNKTTAFIQSYLHDTLTLYNDKIEPIHQIKTTAYYNHFNLYTADNKEKETDNYVFYTKNSDFLYSFFGHVKNDSIIFYNNKGVQLFKADKEIKLDFDAIYYTIPNHQNNKTEYVYKNIIRISLPNDKNGILDSNFNIVLPPIYSSIRSVNNTWLVSKQIKGSNKPLYGLLDNKGKEIIPIKYHSLIPFKKNTPYFAGTINKQTVILDDKGNIILDLGNKWYFNEVYKNNLLLVCKPDKQIELEAIKHSFSSITDNGIISSVCIDTATYIPTDKLKNAVIDITGNIIIPPTHDLIDYYPNNKVFITKNREFTPDKLAYLYNTTGKMIDSTYFNPLLSNNISVLSFTGKGKYLYDSLGNKILLTTQYDSIYKIHYFNCLIAQKKGKIWLLNYKGKVLNDEPYLNQPELSEYNSFFIVNTSNGKYLLMPDGNVIAKEKEESSYLFQHKLWGRSYPIDRLIRWKYQNYKWGIVTDRNEILIPFIYDEIKITNIESKSVTAYIYPTTSHKDTLIRNFVSLNRNNNFYNTINNNITPDIYLYNEEDNIQLNNNWFLSGSNLFATLINNQEQRFDTNTYQYQDYNKANNIYTLSALPSYYLINKRKQVIGNSRFIDIAALSPNLWAVSDINNKWGIIDTNGILIQPYIYDEISILSDISQSITYKNKSIIVSKGERKGVLDSTGTTMIIPIYYERIEYNTNLGMIARNEDGFILLNSITSIPINNIIYNTNSLINHILVNNKYESLLAIKNGEYAFYDTELKKIITLQHSKKAKLLLKGDVSVKWLDSDAAHSYLMYGFIEDKLVKWNKEGKIVFTINHLAYSSSIIGTNEYSDIIKFSFNDSIFILKVKTSAKNKPEVYQIYTYQGKKLSNKGFKDIMFLDNQYLIAKDFNNKYGIIDIYGKTYIPFKYDYINKETTTPNINLHTAFIVKKGDKYGLVSLQNQVKIPCMYQNIVPTSEPNKWIAQNNDNLCGNINTNNDTLIPFYYKGLTLLSKQYFAYQQDCHFGLLDSTSKLILPDTFDIINEIIENRYLIAEKTTDNATNYHSGMIDIQTNKVIIPFSYSLYTYREIDNKHNLINYQWSSDENTYTNYYNNSLKHWVAPLDNYYNNIYVINDSNLFLCHTIDDHYFFIDDKQNIFPNNWQSIKEIKGNYSGKFYSLINDKEETAFYQYLGNGQLKEVVPFTKEEITEIDTDKEEIYLQVGDKFIDYTHNQQYKLPLHTEEVAIGKDNKLWVKTQGKWGYYNPQTQQWIKQNVFEGYYSPWWSEKNNIGILLNTQTELRYYFDEEGNILGERPY